jgi:ligand-binding SRPBCC domain-containing protein
MRTEGSVVIDAPIEQVWEFMSDLQTLPQHNLSLVNVEWEPPLLVGSVATITYQVRGKNRTGTCLVKEWSKTRD